MNVLVASVQKNVRAVLEMLIGDEPGITLVSQAENATSILEQVEVTQPHLVLAEWDVLGPSESDTIRALSRLARHPYLIVYGRRSDWASAALNAGADAFVWEGEGPAALLDAVRNADRSRELAGEQRN